MARSAPEWLSVRERAVWTEVVARVPDASGPGLEAYVSQVATLREAQERVAREGQVVADVKGNPTAHPSIAIARAAQAEVRAWGDRFEPPVF